MSSEIEFLQRMQPVHPDRTAETVQRFLDSHGDWAVSLPVRQWEAFRRLAPDAKSHNGLSKKLTTFLEKAGARAEAGKGWDATTPVLALYEAFKEASEPDNSAAAKFYRERKDQHRARIAESIHEVVCLHLGQRFLDALVVEVLTGIWHARNVPEDAAEGWGAVRSDWVARFDKEAWEGFFRTLTRLSASTEDRDGAARSLVNFLGASELWRDQATRDACGTLAAEMCSMRNLDGVSEGGEPVTRFLERLDSLAKCLCASQEVEH